jgi:hypothetical protein
MVLYILILKFLERRWEDNCEVNGSDHSLILISSSFLCECNFVLILLFPDV